MIIKKVKLKDRGNKGIEVTFNGQRKINDQVAAKRENNVKEEFPLPIPLRQKFDLLKYFFLTMLGVWRDDQWTDYLLDDYSGFRDVDDIIENMDIDEDKVEVMKNQISSFIMAADTAFSNTMIEGYELEGTKIKILGTYEAIEGKPIKINLPFISEDDDYDFHQEASEVMSEISSDIFEHLKQENLEIGDVKKILELYLNDQAEIERIREQTEEENYEELIHRLESKGAIVMPLEGSELEKKLNENNDSEKAEVASSKTVNSSKFKEGEDHKEDEEKNEEVPYEENPDVEDNEPDDIEDEKKEGFF